MNNLDLNKKCLLDLKKAELLTYDKLRLRRDEMINEIRSEVICFVDNIVIPQVLEYNAIGFSKKEFLYKRDSEYYCYGGYNSVIWNNKNIFAEVLSEKGFDVVFEDLYDFWERSSIDSILIVDWNIELTKPLNNNSLLERLRSEHNNLKSCRCSIIEDEINDKILSDIKLKNERGELSFEYNRYLETEDILDKIIIIEILKKHGIYAKLDKNFENIIVKWEKPLNDYYSEDGVFNAYKYQVMLDRMYYSSEYTLDVMPNYIYRRRVSNNGKDEVCRVKFWLYKDIKFNTNNKSNSDGASTCNCFVKSFYKQYFKKEDWLELTIFSYTIVCIILLITLMCLIF